MDSNICLKCGLPKEICICEQVAREQQKVFIRKQNVKYDKWMTIIEGLNSKDINIKELAQKLKKKFCCGGTFKNGIIKLQGKHNLKEALVEEGFSTNEIKII